MARRFPARVAPGEADDCGSEHQRIASHEAAQRPIHAVAIAGYDLHHAVEVVAGEPLGCHGDSGGLIGSSVGGVATSSSVEASDLTHGNFESGLDSPCELAL